MHQRVLSAVAVAAVLAGLAVPVRAGAAEPPRTERPEAAFRLPPSGRLQVKFKSGVGSTARADALAKVAARGHAVGVQRRIAALNAVVLDVRDQAAVLRLLRSDKRVEYVEPESRYRAFAETPSAELVEIGAAATHAQPSPNVGAGTQIAVIDSPVSNTVGDLDGAGKVVDAGDFTTNYVEHPDDDFFDVKCNPLSCPHGTGVASVAAGEADDAGLVGVAPGATIRSYSVFREWVYQFTDGNGDVVGEWHELGADSGAIVAALTAVAAYGATPAGQSLVAVNMSLGGQFGSRLVRDAIALVRQQAPQVTIVVASGNDGRERANFPAGDPGVLSVGATGNRPDSDEQCDDPPAATWTVAGFSTRGDVDVVAPGHCVAAWYSQTDKTTNASGGAFSIQPVSGTSFAAPMVAGVAALLGAAGVKGDAARAAIIASATGPSLAAGAGKTHALAALHLADGPDAYTAVSVDRGNHVASSVGRRDVEVIRVQPGATETTPLPAPTVTSGYGTITGLGTPLQTTGLATGRFRYATPGANQAGRSFSLTANGGTAGADDTIVLPMRMLDATNGFEGVPAASGEAGSAALAYGTRSAYIRSVAVPSSGGRFDYSYTFGEATVQPSAARPASLYVWEPATVGGTADAASEPVWQSFAAPDRRTGTDYWSPGGAEPDVCEGNPNDQSTWRYCRTGRYLVGFVAEAPQATSSSTSRYALKLSYGAWAPKLTTRIPALASSSGPTSLPFGIYWGGTRTARYDVSWGVRTKSGSTWSGVAFQPWLTNTTRTSAAFGTGNSPTTVKAGQTYWFRIQGWDALGNPTLPVTTKTIVPYDDRAGSLRYSTGSTAWRRLGGLSDRWLTTATRTSAAGARASLTTDTSAFQIVGDKCSVCGQFKVYVDGVHKKTVDTYRSSTAVRQVLWSSGSLGRIKSHRVTIVVVGTRGRPRVVLDGIAALR